MADHPLWWLLTTACVVWYSTIVLFVAFKGARDISMMLRRLKDRTGDGKNSE